MCRSSCISEKYIFCQNTSLSALLSKKKSWKKIFLLRKSIDRFQKMEVIDLLSLSLSRSFTQFELVLGSVITEFQILCKINPREIDFSITIFWIFTLRKLNKCPISKKKSAKMIHFTRVFFRRLFKIFWPGAVFRLWRFHH